MQKQPFVFICLLLGLVTGSTDQAVRAENKQQSPCGNPLEVVSRRPLPKAEQERVKKLKPQGSVAIVISEGGEVVDAKAAQATSDEAGRLMIDLAKGMIFKPRPKCGPVKTVVKFDQGK